VHTGRLALIGDASGYLDPITGEGLSLAFHQAFALAGALCRGDLSFYAAAHRRLSETPWKVTRRLLTVERHPWARRRLIRGLSRDPALFSKHLSVLAREQPESALGPAATLQLAWKLACS
jgi:2-polyprenyl-6-methoxyphenol hydroxylase-like FAD-dependent oxidoreductase